MDLHDILVCTAYVQNACSEVMARRLKYGLDLSLRSHLV